MAIRDKMRANASHLLQPGENIQAVIGAQTKSPWFALVSIWIIVFTNAYRAIIVTDRRIIVTKAGRFSMTAVRDVVHEFPRSVQIGPATGVWAKCTTLGEPLYIHKRFHKDVAAADAVRV